MVDDIPEGLAASGAVEIAQVLGRIDGGHVLDVGTGNGDFISSLIVFLGDYSTFTGIDLDSEDFEEGRERFEGESVELLEMDGSKMTFNEGTFDTVCISNSVHHLEHVHDVLAEMVRVLRSGGRFILQEMFNDDGQSTAQETDTLQHHWSARVDTAFGTYHHETYSKEEIMSVVEDLNIRDTAFFETTHSIKCLTCEDRFTCEDPLDLEFLSNAVNEIEENLERLKDLPDKKTRAALSEQGLDLEERIRKSGVSPASTLFVIGRK